MTDFPLGLYQHYKGNFYNVIGPCRHSETLEELVVYQALYGDYGLWVRPLNLFLETVEINGQTLQELSNFNSPPPKVVVYPGEIIFYRILTREIPDQETSEPHHTMFYVDTFV